MSYSHSFIALTPPGLYTPGRVWASVEVQQADTATGDSTTGLWELIDTIEIAADPTPEAPDPVNITTGAATLERGWFRFVFVDSAGSRAPASDPIQSPAAEAFALDEDFTPDATDVARLCGAYTREYVGGYDQQAGREQDTFTDATSPTLAQVEGFIAAAVQEVRARLGYSLLLADAPLAKTAVTWHAAAQVEAKRLPGGSDDSDGAYRAHIANFAACMSELQTQAKRRLWFVD